MPKDPKMWRRYSRFWGANVEGDVDDELRFHIESRVQEAIARGASPEQAHAEALKRFGDVERVRVVLTSIGKHTEGERRRTDWLGELAQDLRVAVRSLRKTPAFTLVALITLALGIGANTAVFSVVNGVLLRPLPYPGGDRVTILWDAMPGLGFQKGNVSNAEVVDVRKRTTAFDAVGAFRGYGGTLTGRGEPERIDALQVSASIFDILATPAAKGRVFTAQEDQRGRDGVIVLGDGFWRRRFGADQSVLGKMLQLDGTPRIVIGILPPTFTLEKADAYIPLAMNTDSTVQQRTWHNFVGMARIKKDVSVDQANAQLGALAKSLRAEFPDKYPRDMGFGMFVQPLQDALVGNARRSLLVLLGAVALVLLIACVNVANLMLARAEARQREFAVRVALGARGGRLVRQLLTESTLLAVAGGALGALLASWGVRALLAVSPGAVPRSETVHVDGVVLLVTLGVALVTGIAFGLVPALHAARPELQSVLRDEGRGTSAGHGRARTRSLLIITELALAVVVLTSAGLLVRSFWRLQRAGAGIQPDNVMAMSLSLPRARYEGTEKPQRFFAEILARVARLPGVRDATLAYSLPTKGYNSWDIEIEGQPKAPGEASPSPIPQFVTPRYFAVLGIPLRAGRFLDEHDDNPAVPAVVVNETFAKQLLPKGAVGKRFRMAGDTTWMTIVGVVGDVKMSGPGAETRIEWAANLSESKLIGGAIRDLWVVARMRSDPSAIVPAARRELWAMDPNVNFADVATMTDVMSQAVARPRFTMLLLASFAAVALVLAAVGVYGVIAYSVSQRTRELGIRMALGARAADVMRLVVGQGVGVAAAGVALGLVASLGATRLLGNLLFETNARDPMIFIAIATMLAVVAIAASFIPARRATRVDPAIALRE
ncbi:MAG: ABC transporter permease [Gemmatimonadota bacterium]|nr:ABC transporter permease [Gemmatimonadota bacterium]